MKYILEYIKETTTPRSPYYDDEKLTKEFDSLYETLKECVRMTYYSSGCPISISLGLMEIITSGESLLDIIRHLSHDILIT